MMRRMISHDDIRVLDPDSIETPAMVVFEHRVDVNIRDLCELAGAENLAAHVKTTKSIDVIRKQVAAGIVVMKAATLSELETAVAAGCHTAILAYPILQSRKAKRLVRLAVANRGVDVVAVVGQLAHVGVLSAAAGAASATLPVMLDLNVGMHRTGHDADAVGLEIYRAIAADANLVPAGLHAYDGQDHASDPDERERLAMAHVEDVKVFRKQLTDAGLSVPLVVGGGSYSFPYYAREEGMLGSPGTTVYWDAGYQAQMPELTFRPAAMVLTQVIDRHPDQGTVTLDLGSKAISADGPLENRVRFLGYQNVDAIMQSEEHGVFRFADHGPELGDYLLAVPVHVCPTTTRYPGSHVIDADGVVCGFWPHTARDR